MLALKDWSMQKRMKVQTGATLARGLLINLIIKNKENCEVIIYGFY